MPGLFDDLPDYDPEAGGSAVATVDAYAPAPAAADDGTGPAVVPVPAPIDDAAPTAAPSGGNLGKVTSYGYLGDRFGGPGSVSARIGARNNPLDNLSMAVSPDVESALMRAGFKLGDLVTVHTDRGDETRRWDDRTAQDNQISSGQIPGLSRPLRGRFDFRSSGKPSPLDDARVLGFSRPGQPSGPARARLALGQPVQPTPFVGDPGSPIAPPTGPGQDDPAAEPLELPGIPFGPGEGPNGVAAPANSGRSGLFDDLPAVNPPHAFSGKAGLFDDLPEANPDAGKPADLSAFEPFLVPSSAPAPPASGFFASAAASATQNAYNTAAAIPDAIDALKTAGTEAFDPADQALLDRIWARIHELYPQVHPAFSAGGGRFGRAGVPAADSPAALELARLTAKAHDLSTNPAMRFAAADLRQQGADSYAQYGANPAAKNMAAQAGRAVGGLGATVPFLMTPFGIAPAAAQMEAESYEGTYRAADTQARAAGETDEAKIADLARRAATRSAAALIPTLLAYTVGGKLVGAAMQRFLPAASPIVRGLLTGTASAAANSAVSATARAVAGQNVVPNLEQLIPDLAFGAMHGAGDAASQRGSPAYLNARIDALKADLRGKGATPPADSGPSTPPNASPQPDSPAPSPAAEAPPRAPAPADSPAPAADDELDIFNQGPDPWQDYPRVTPAAESAAAAPPEPQPDAVAANPDEAADYLYRSLFSRLATGKIPEKGSVGRALQEAKPAYDAGTITSPEDLRAWMTGDPALRARLAQINGGAAPQSDSGGPQFSQRPAADDPATIAQANGFWQRAFRVLGPGLARQFRLFVGQNAVDQFAEDNKGRLPTTEDKAAVDTALRSVYMFNAASRPGAEPGDVLNLMHESAHAFEGALQPETQAKLGELMQAERQAKAGPVFGNRPVGPDGKPLAMDPRALTDPKEWFAERMALQNFQWANQRVRAGVSDGSLIGRMAASQRLAWVKLQQLVTNRPVDFISNRMRNFLAKGDPAYAGGYGAGGAPQFSRRPEDPVAEAEKLHALARSQTMLPDPQDLRPDFHVGTLVGRALMPWIQKMGETARSISPDDPVWSKLDPRHQQRLRATLNRGNQQIQHARAMWPEFRSRMADVVASLPDRRVRDARSGQMADPFAGLKQAFPGGEAGELEPAVSRAADLSQAVFARSHPGFAENGQRIPGGHSIRDFLNILEVLHEAGAGDYTRGIDELTRREGRSQTTAEALEQARLEHEGGAMLGEETRHELPGFEGYSRSDTGPQFSRRPVADEFADAADVVKEKDGQTPKTFYHGTANAEALARSGVFDVQRQDPRALYGPGFYFTGDAKVAGGDGTGGGYESKNSWQKKRVAPGEDPHALMAQLEHEGYETWLQPEGDLVLYRKPGNPGVVPAHVLLKRPVDMDADVHDEGALVRLEEDGSSHWKIRSPLLDHLYEKYPHFDWDHFQDKLDRAMQEENPTNGDVYRQLAKTVDEDGRQFGKARLNEALRAVGYDGITHIGGGNTGGDPHRVVIAFHPEQIYGVHGGAERKAELGPQYFSRRPAPLEEEAELKHAARAVSERISARDTEQNLKQGFDAIDNQAFIRARMVANKVRGDFLGNRQDLEAAPFVIEAGGQPWKLENERRRVERGKPAIAKKWLPVLDYAIEHFGRLQQLSHGYIEQMAQQSARERGAGIDFRDRANYVSHVLHDPAERGRLPALLGVPDTSGKSKYFTKQRTFNSLGEALAAGMDPRSSNLADLFEHRVRTGERLFQEAKWLQTLRDVRDPSPRTVTDENGASTQQPGLPIVGQAEFKKVQVPREEVPAQMGAQMELFEGPDGTRYERASDGTVTKPVRVVPEGYSDVQVGSGQRVPIHNQYADLFRSLFQPSAIRNYWLGRQALRVVQGVKHGAVLFDSFHVANVGLRSFLANNGRVNVERPLSLLEYSPADLQRMVERGEIKPEVKAWADQNRPAMVALVQHGLNVGQIADAIYSDSIGKVREALGNVPGLGAVTDPVLGKIDQFNTWVFQKLTRGVMLDTALSFLKRNQARMRGSSPDQVLYRTVSEVNNLFGNLGRQGWLTSRTAQDAMRLLFFAPSWMSGTFRTERNALWQPIKSAVSMARGRGATEMNASATVAKSIALMFVLNQGLNLAFTGHSTFQNEDGHKLDAWIPGGAHGFWFSPFSMMAKISESMHRYYERAHAAGDLDSQGEAAFDAGEQILGNKLSMGARAAKTMLTGRDYAGRPLRGLSARMIEAASNVAPLPIFTGPFIQRDPGELPRLTLGGNAPGAIEKQAAASLGAHLIPADGPEAKMYAAARPFRQDAGTNDPSEYGGLRRFLDAGETARARAELQHLVNGGKTLPQIDHAMGFSASGWKPPMFTGRDQETEHAFIGALSPPLRATYGQAVQAARARAQSYQQVRASVAQALTQLSAGASAAKREQIRQSLLQLSTGGN